MIHFLYLLITETIKQSSKETLKGCKKGRGNGPECEVGDIRLWKTWKVNYCWMLTKPGRCSRCKGWKQSEKENTRVEGESLCLMFSPGGCWWFLVTAGAQLQLSRSSWKSFVIFLFWKNISIRMNYCHSHAGNTPEYLYLNPLSTGSKGKFWDPRFAILKSWQSPYL